MLVYGKNAVYEYLIKNEVKMLYLMNNFNDNKINEYLENVKIKYVEKYVLDRMVKGLHQGIIAEVEDFKYSELDDITKNETSVIVMLDHLEDPHNLGAIIRTAEAAGINGIIIPKDRSVDVNATVIKTSVGAIENIPVVMVTNLKNTIDELKEKGYWIVGTDMDGSDYTSINYTGKTVIIVGNEGSGMSDIVKKQCDFIASIPMYGKVNSLNASVATALVIYEAVKQNRK